MKNKIITTFLFLNLLVSASYAACDDVYYEAREDIGRITVGDVGLAILGLLPISTKVELQKINELQDIMLHSEMKGDYYQLTLNLKNQSVKEDNSMKVLFNKFKEKVAKRSCKKAVEDEIELMELINDGNQSEKFCPENKIYSVNRLAKIVAEDLLYKCDK